MSNSIGDLRNSGLQGNNFPWQLKMLEGLQKIYDEVKKPLTCAEDSIALCGPAGGLPVVIDCNDKISLCVNGAVVDATNSLPVTVVNPLPLEVNINQANDSILIYGFDGTTNQPISVDSSGAVNVNATVTIPTPLPVSQDATSNPWIVDATISGPLGVRDCDEAVSTALCSSQAQDLADIKTAVQPITTITPNILSTTGTGTIAAAVYSITFFNSGPDDELISFDGGTTPVVLSPGVSITMDAGGINNKYPAGVFTYDVIGTGPIIITYNS